MDPFKIKINHIPLNIQWHRENIPVLKGNNWNTERRNVAKERLQQICVALPYDLGVCRPYGFSHGLGPLVAFSFPKQTFCAFGIPGAARFLP